MHLGCLQEHIYAPPAGRCMKRTFHCVHSLEVVGDLFHVLELALTSIEEIPLCIALCPFSGTDYIPLFYCYTQSDGARKELCGNVCFSAVLTRSVWLECRIFRLSLPAATQMNSESHTPE